MFSPQIGLFKDIRMPGNILTY